MSDPEPPTNRVETIKSALTRARHERDRVVRILTESLLVAEASDALPWDRVAAQGAGPIANGFAGVVRLAAIIQDTNPPASIPLDALTQRVSDVLLDLFANSAAAKEAATTRLLTAAWEDCAHTPTGDDDATLATLTERLHAPGGWPWLASFSVSLGDLFALDGIPTERPTSTQTALPIAEPPAYAFPTPLPDDAPGLAPIEPDPLATAIVEGLGLGNPFRDGMSWVPNDPISRGLMQAIVSPSWESPTPTTGTEMTFTVRGNRTGSVQFRTAGDALAIVQGIPDALADTMTVLLAMAVDHRRAGKPGENFLVKPGDILGARGIKKHKEGGYRTEDVAGITRHIDALGAMMVDATVEGQMRGQNGKRGSVTIRSPLLDIDSTATVTGPDGRTTLVGWYLKPGRWSDQLDVFSPQFALFMQSILSLHSHDGSIAKRLARYFMAQYRIRSHEETYAQPYSIRTLLTNAGIPIPDRNGNRFRGRFEEALNVLMNEDAMKGPACIGNWYYPSPVEPTGRGSFDRWVGSTIVTLPPDSLIETYREMHSRKKPQTIGAKSWASKKGAGAS